MGVIVLLAVGYSAWALVRPLPLIVPRVVALPPVTAGVSNSLAWPSQGQAAVGINPSGVLALHGDEQPVPIASTAKVLTALMVLKKHPLALRQSGPKILITADDVRLYDNYLASNGSVTAVADGETLTQYQMLQAILLPSANNIADSLAIWAFGSLTNYASFANNYSRQLGLTHTHVGSDASGFDPSTVSTAHDLVLIGEAAMQDPVLAEIVGQSSASVPVAGTIQNVNGLLGTNGIVGVKTGNTDQAGGVFLAAQQAIISGKSLVLISAVVGTPTLFDAMKSSLPLLDSAQHNFTRTHLVTAHTTIGSYAAPWGSTTTAITAGSIASVVWNGSTVTPIVDLQTLSVPAKAQTMTGTLRLPQSTFGPALTASVVTTTALGRPSWLWRLTHPV